MDRRAFVTVMGGGILAALLVAEAQPAGKVPRVGFLLGLSPGPSREVDAFQRGLRERGYIEGRNIAIDYRYARGQVERLPELAAELVRLNPDVIVAPYTPPALAAKRATSTIPIVFPMQLQIGDKLSDETGQWEVVGRPHTTGGGKKTEARVQTSGQARPDGDQNVGLLREGHGAPASRPGGQAMMRERLREAVATLDFNTTSAQLPATDALVPVLVAGS